MNKINESITYILSAYKTTLETKYYNAHKFQ